MPVNKGIFETKSMLSQIQDIYLTFLSGFPGSVRPIISIGLAVLIVFSVFKILKKQFIFLILLIILLPASVPILKSIWQGVVSLVKFLLGNA